MNGHPDNPVGAAENVVLRVEKIVTRGLEHLLTLTFIVIFGLVVLLVVLRYLFNSTVVGGNEATVMLFIYTTALGSAVEVARGKHIVIDTFTNYLPARVRYWLNVFNLLVVGLLHAALLKYSLDWIGAVGGSENPVMHIPEGALEIAVPLGCSLTILFCITRIFAAVAARPAASA